MEYRTLGKTGLEVSVLSFGASSLGGVFRSVTENDGIRAVHIALEMGINYIDVSPYYGLTKAETVLGKALKDVSRDTYFLATKLGRYGDEFEDFDFSAGRVVSSIDESLQRLGVDYLDIIQCHDIEFGSLDQIVNETIPALRKVQEQGKVRFVGITGMPVKIFPSVLDRIDVDTILSYCHYSVNDTSLEDLLPYLTEKNIGLINASPLSMGLLSQRGAPDWHPATDEIKQVCAQAAKYCADNGKSLEKLAVQFSVRNPEIPTTLVGTANPENMRKNIGWVEEAIDEELLQEVRKILKPIHNKTWPIGKEENN